jgi:hypothetical protein
MECMIVYGDLPPDVPTEQRKLAGEAFRRIGAGLVSRHYSAYSWVRWFYTRAPIAWDIHSSGERLIRIGNGIQFSQISSPNNLADVTLIRRSLRLPDPEPSPVDREVMALTAQPAPIRSGDLSP